jgi:hypothetical protein
MRADDKRRQAGSLSVRWRYPSSIRTDTTLMPQLDAKLEQATLRWRTSIHQEAREKVERNLRRLSRRGILTIGDLVAQVLELPPAQLDFALWLFGSLKVRQARPIVLQQLLRSTPRGSLKWGVCLGMLPAWAPVGRAALEIGWRELNRTTPNAHWLWTALEMLFSELRSGVRKVEAQELVLEIFERTELPGRLRGDAGDKLGGWCDHDRRTRRYRRCVEAAIRGLSEDAIEVQFWSMYIIASLNSNRSVRDPAFARAVPRLREIAADDHRLAPGYWWPMSAEAEDALGCIETGNWPQPDAAERWHSGLPARGAVTVN